MRSEVEINNFLRSLLDPEQFGHAVTAEVRDRARCLLEMEAVETGEKDLTVAPWDAGRLAEQSAGISISPISMNEVDHISISTDNMSSVVHIPETLSDVINLSSYSTDSITITPTTLGEPLTVTLGDLTDTIILSPEGDD
jgi:hypothetical protein